MEQLEKVVLPLLNPNRVAHVLGCRDTAVELARRWGANEEDAAALLAQLKATCEPYGTEVSVSEDGLFEFKPM